MSDLREFRIVTRIQMFDMGVPTDVPVEIARVSESASHMTSDEVLRSLNDLHGINAWEEVSKLVTRECLIGMPRLVGKLASEFLKWANDASSQKQNKENKDEHS